MFGKLFYSKRPELSAGDKPMFSDENYECVGLYLTKNGKPVALSGRKVNTPKAWKVQHGFSTIYFRCYSEAAAYCRKHFCNLDGKPMKEAQDE